MKKVYSAQNHVMIALLKQIIESQGIHCVVKNELLSGAVGELPPIECWPELWIIDDDQFEWARRLVEATLNSHEEVREIWQCPHCGELLEGQFTQCWRCGQVRQL